MLCSAMISVRTQATTSTYQSYCPKAYQPSAHKRIDPLRQPIRVVRVSEQEALRQKAEGIW